MTYLVVPEAPARCRLLAKLAVHYPRGFRGLVMRWLLPWGVLLMMRRQLLNLKRLAESPAPEPHAGLHLDAKKGDRP